MEEFDHTFWADRPWDFKKQIIDQAGHVVYAIAILLPVLLIPNRVIGCAISATLLGTIREWEQWKKKNRLHLFDRMVDVLFFSLGGIIIGYFMKGF